MTITVAHANTPSEQTEVIAHLITVEIAKTGLTAYNADTALLESTGFKGKKDQISRQKIGDQLTAFVGIGKAADVTPASLRRAAAVFARTCRRHQHISLVLSDFEDITTSDALQALTEGAILGNYRYTRFKSSSSDKISVNNDDNDDAGNDDVGDDDVDNDDDIDASDDDSDDMDDNSDLDSDDDDSDNSSDNDRKLETVELITDVSDDDAIKRGIAIANATCLARDLVNEPGGSLTAPKFAEQAIEVAQVAGLEVEVWELDKIKAERFGGLLGVNRGSELPPRFVQIKYTPATDAPTIALVGKGITFDAGGLSIKTATGMMTMKMDMAGAAAVLATMSAIAILAPPVAVHAYMPLTDNMLGGDATRPGDVLTIRNGKTIEVANTDAEGRLILADALSLACESKPDAIIDLATLTGACMVALGPRIAGLMGNNDNWINQIKTAADTTGERVWHLPLPADYETQFKSNIADIKNIGTSHGGALTAGLILQKFVSKKIPWAHLDIAGPAHSDSVEAEICKGGTGFGVRTLIELVSSFQPPQD